MSEHGDAKIEEYSKPLTELPSFLSTISMVGDDRSAIVQNLTHAERPAPARYEPARDFFRCCLQGKLSFDAAYDQAGRIADPTERRCAVDVLLASKAYLNAQQPTRIFRLSGMSFPLPNGLDLAIKPVWLRDGDPGRLMVLHFWEKPLSAWQLSAAGAILRTALRGYYPDYVACDLDFVSVSVPPNLSMRQFKNYNWTDLQPLDERQLGRFLKHLCEAWSVYQSKAPRKLSRRRGADFFA